MSGDLIRRLGGNKNLADLKLEQPKEGMKKLDKFKASRPSLQIQIVSEKLESSCSMIRSVV